MSDLEPNRPESVSGFCTYSLDKPLDKPLLTEPQVFIRGKALMTSPSERG